MSGRTQQSLVAERFGAQADAYLASAVHARGEDLEQMASLLSGSARVLDLGCGGGHVAFTLAPVVGEVTAYDLLPEMLEVVARTAAGRGLGNIVTRPGTAERLSFEDGAFDAVASRFSAHHWHDFRQGLREAARVLRPGGQAVFVDVVSPGPPALDSFLQAMEILRDTSHVRDYSVAEWQDAAGAAGFTVAGVTSRRLHLEFGAWVERMRTPAVMADAIHALQDAVSDEVRRHFEIRPDHSFTVDTALLALRRA